MISGIALSLRITSFTTSPLNPFRNLTRLFSSWSVTPPSRDEPEGGGVGESKAYCQARKFARPASVEWSSRLRNSVSLIGSVEYPLKRCAVKDGKVGAYTILLVKPSPDSHRHFRVTLWMWDLLAERALIHLKPSDYIYVSGQLGSYIKSTSEGRERLYYKVTAKELNYVQLHENYEVVAKSGREAGESWEQKCRNRLHTLQILFANPYDWYDQRKMKKSPRHPDFKHKSTGEAIWLDADDPSWVKKQVELLDSTLTGGVIDDAPCGSFASDWLSDNQSVSRHPGKLSDRNQLLNGIDDTGPD